MGYHVVHAAGHEWEVRPSVDGGAERLAADITVPGGLTESRARLWRYPPSARGRRHLDNGQEEVFVVVSGTLTMLLGEPPERVELAPTSVVTVARGTPLQLLNESDGEVVVFAYGAPPVTGQAEFL